MSLPQWAIDAGADPEIGWEPHSNVIDLIHDVGDTLTDCRAYSIRVRCYECGAVAFGNLPQDDVSSWVEFDLPSPAQAIRAAEGLIRALRGDA